MSKMFIWTMFLLLVLWRNLSANWGQPVVRSLGRVFAGFIINSFIIWYYLCAYWNIKGLWSYAESPLASFFFFFCTPSWQKKNNSLLVHARRGRLNSVKWTQHWLAVIAHVITSMHGIPKTNYLVTSQTDTCFEVMKNFLMELWARVLSCCYLNKVVFCSKSK